MKKISIALTVALAAGLLAGCTANSTPSPESAEPAAAAMEWWEYPRHTAEPSVQAWMTDTEVRLSAGGGPGLPEDAQYRWTVDGVSTKPAASLPAEPLKLQRGDQRYFAQVTFAYELGGTHIKAASEIFEVPALGE